MAGFKVGFIMFRIIHCSSAFPGSMKKSDSVVRPKKANMENGEDGNVIIERDGKRGGVEVQYGEKYSRMEEWQERREKRDFRKTSFQLSRQNISVMKRSSEVSSKETWFRTALIPPFPPLVKLYFMLI